MHMTSVQDYLNVIEIRWNRPGLAIVLALTMGIAFAQTATVQGRVTNSSGAVIPGASVTVADH